MVCFAEMSEASELIEVEGSWEEILLRAAEFSGRRVKVTLLADEALPTIEHIAHRWAEESERVTPEQVPEVRGIKAELRRILVDKFRHQGLLA
jgi:hypothetical protein